MPVGTDALIWQPTLLNYLRDVGFIDRPLRNWLGYYDLYHNPHFGIDYPLLYLGVPELSLYSAYQWDQLYIWVHRLIMLGGAYVFVARPVLVRNQRVHPFARALEINRVAREAVCHCHER